MSNLVTRTISGLVFLTVLTGSLLWRAEAFGAVFLFITLVMMAEYIRISTGTVRHTPQIFALMTGLLLFVTSFAVNGYGLDPKWFCITVFPMAFTIISVLLRNTADSYGELPYLLGSIPYIAVPFSLCPFIVFGNGGEFDATPLLALLILLWSSDIGAYIFGMTLRNVWSTKLCPSISPKKTVVGYLGGLSVTLLAGWLTARSGMISYGVGHTLAIALTVNVAGTFGDLAESQFKRFFSVKDSGNIMPGHGGLLDRFDGALLAFPAAISYILLFNLK